MSRRKKRDSNSAAADTKGDGKQQAAASHPSSSAAAAGPAVEMVVTTQAAGAAASDKPASAAAGGANPGGRSGIVDMWAHNRLRGAAAVWIVIFHCYGLPKRSELPLNLEGSSIMPMFFMLSGFALAATYGRRLWAAPPALLPSCCRRRRPHQQQPPASPGRAQTAAIEEGHGGSNGSSSSTEEEEEEEVQQQPPLQAFPLRTFYQNRFARVMPVYYFCLLLCLPLWVVNVGDFPFARRTFIPSLVTSVIPSTTLLSPLAGTYLATLNPPGWFVCTLVFFFLFFPRWVATAQRLSDQQLLSRIVWHYWLQYALLQGIFSLLPLAVPGLRPFATATTNPLTRFPLFLMGIYAGLLALRHPHVPDAEEKEEKENEGKAAAGELPMVAAAAAAGGSLTVSVERQMNKDKQDTAAVSAAGPAAMPWPACFLGCFPIPPALAASRCGRALLLPLSSKPPATRQDWARMATLQSAGVLLVTLAIGAADSYVSTATHGRVALRSHVWLQALVPMVQLNILVALTRDGRLSLVSRALGTRLAQWLGKVSMDVYLVHWPLIAYFALALHGPRNFETLLKCYGVADDDDNASAAADPEHYDECLQAMAAAKRFPPWGVAVILPLALLAGEVLYRCVDEPARKLLRRREGQGQGPAAAAGKAQAQGAK